jgi:glycine/D-amino acid oxidase-like deaminating enzyme
MPHVDVVVVGAGVVGLATGRELARRGRRVAVLERYCIGHPRGSSFGDARMRVPAAFPSSDYVLRGLVADEGWRALERETGERLLVRTGCLSWGDGWSALAEGLAAHDQCFELVGAAEAEQAHPGLRMPPGVVAIYQPEAQTLLADRVLGAFARSTRAAGALLVEDVRVERVEPGDSEVAVRTSAGKWMCEQVVVAAGPWTAGLLQPLGIELDVRTTLQTVSYFDAGPDAPRVGLIEYGDPDPYALWSPSGRKAAEHRPGPQTHPDAARTPVAEALASTQAWIAARFGEAVAARRTQVETCMYTMTPTEELLVEAHGRIVVVSACSGHGFQYAPDTARRTADVMQLERRN